MPHPEFIHVKNFGFLRTQLPTDLFIKLKEECQNIKELKKMKSGLGGRGSPQHFFIEKCFSKLKEYIFYCVAEYEKNFKYMETLTFLNKDAPLLVAPPWVNVQKRYEFLPMHHHDGILSYNIWIQIPYDIKKEQKENVGHASQLQFIYPMVHGTMGFHKFNLSQSDEGSLIMFPASFIHALYPFYTSNNVRLSIAGNVLFEVR